MHILCTICSDLVNQAESLYVTKCGHIFHHHCLAQWIERSKSCPQCRNKVTDRCMFRMYPTVSNENSGEDAATLQARLDDAMLQLRTQRASFQELEDRLAAITTDLNKKEELLKAAEKRLVAREAAAAALREQLAYVREQTKDTQRLRDENERMHNDLQTLNGLQRVLRATAAEVEGVLRAYPDARTVAVFAAALKRALCESESKKREWRARQLAAAQDAAAQRARADREAGQRGQLQEKLVNLEREYESSKHKRKASASDPARAAKLPCPAPAAPAPAPAAAPAPDRAADDSFVQGAESAESPESPYLALERGAPALCALRRRAPPAVKPSEFRLLQASRAAHSIFHGASRAGLQARAAPCDASYDGLGGHTRHDLSPAPAPAPARAAVPRPGARHRLKKFDPAGNQDISKMFSKLHDL